MEPDKPKPPVARRPDVLRKLNKDSLLLIERGLVGELPHKLRPHALVPVRGRSNELAVTKQPSFLSSCLPVIPDSPHSEPAGTSSDDEHVVTIKKSFSFRDKFSRMSLFGKDKDKTDKPKCKTISENEALQEPDKDEDHGHHPPGSPTKSDDHRHNKRFWFFRHKEIHEKKPQRHSDIYVRSKSFEFLPRAVEEQEEQMEKQKRPTLKNSISYVFGSTDSLDDWISNDERDFHPTVSYDNDHGVFLKGIKELPASESSNNSSMSIVTSASSGIVVNMFKTQSVQDILKEFDKAVEMFSENYLSDSEPYTKRTSTDILPVREKRKSSSFCTLPSPKVIQVNKANVISEDFKAELNRVFSLKRKSVEVKVPSARRGSVTDWFVLEDPAALAVGPPAKPASSEVNKYRRAQKKPINRVRRISSTKYVSNLQIYSNVLQIVNFYELILRWPSWGLKDKDSMTTFNKLQEIRVSRRLKNIHNWLRRLVY